MSSSNRHTSRHRSAAGLAAAVHHAFPLCHPSTTPALSIHTVRGGIASSSIFRSPHNSARSDDGKSSGHDPYRPCCIAPRSSTKMADQPALRAPAGGPPRTAPSVNPTPVKVKSPSGARPPHHRVIALGTFAAAILAGMPKRKSGSLQCAALCALSMMALSLKASRMACDAGQMQNLWCKLPMG